jgi:hypothetical protein
MEFSGINMCSYKKKYSSAFVVPAPLVAPLAAATPSPGSGPVHFFFYYLYPCFSHLEHRSFVKRFVSLQFLELRQSVGLLDE